MSILENQSELVKSIGVAAPQRATFAFRKGAMIAAYAPSVSSKVPNNLSFGKSRAMHARSGPMISIA